MSREELSDGYVRLMAELYEPQAYFDRVDDLYRSTPASIIDRAWQAYASTHPWVRAGPQRGPLAAISRPLRPPADQNSRSASAPRLPQAFLVFLRARPEPQVLRVYALKCAIHWHMHVFVDTLRNRAGPLVNSY